MPESATLQLKLADEAATAALGARLAETLRPLLPIPLVVYLSGELGAGKTCLVRGVLRALGVTGTIRSPTYTLLEIYSVAGIEVAHLDLYRVGAATELEQLGLRDLLEPGCVMLIEWPERGAGALPASDLQIEIGFAGSGRSARLRFTSLAGEEIQRRLMR